MQYEKLSYLVVSDQGESEMFLRSLLRQVTRLCLLARVLLCARSWHDTPHSMACRMSRYSSTW